MRRIFADTYYWVALLNPKDEGHRQAIEIGPTISNCVLMTTEEVLSEVLTFFSSRGPGARTAVTSLIENILADEKIVVLPQSHESFMQGLALYRMRLDKGFSMIDCIVMAAMRKDGVLEVLTHDDHFRQEGFTTLL